MLLNMDTGIYSLIIACLAFIISAITFWLTRISKGELKMTKPSVICFLGKNGADAPKVMIRTLLYATSERGQYIQNMFVKLSNEKILKNFEVWAYEQTVLVRGSGLYVSKSGVNTYHHFLLNKNDNYTLVSGSYTLDVFAEVVDGATKKIHTEKIFLTEENIKDLNSRESLYFDWSPSEQKYIQHTKFEQEYDLY
jgi:hypothetical protein